MNVSAENLSDAEKREINEAARAAEAAQDPAKQIKDWLLSTHAATLCTNAARPAIEGYPFGSVVPFTVDKFGRPVILTADIAAHTMNLRKDPRATLFVSDPHAEGDPQSSWRVGIIGDMQRILPRGKKSKYLEGSEVIEPEEYNEIHARYVERVPNAEAYIKQHSFDYWRMNTVVTARYIAGFGRICWVEGERLLRTDDTADFGPAVQSAIDHMNEDHASNMVEMCQGFYGVEPKGVKMTNLGPTGFLVEVSEPEGKYFFSFGREIQEKEIRTSVIDVLKRARAAQASA